MTSYPSCVTAKDADLQLAMGPSGRGFGDFPTCEVVWFPIAQGPGMVQGQLSIVSLTNLSCVS